MAVFDVGNIVQQLDSIRGTWRDSQRRSREPDAREFPSRDVLAHVVNQLKGVLFPMRLGPENLRHDGENLYVGYTLNCALQSLFTQAQLELRYQARHAPPDPSGIADRALEAVNRFAESLPDVRRLLDLDVLAAYQGDPAAGSVDEVLLCYPGILAMIHYRLAHQLYLSGLHLLARIITEIAHSETGIDIHPGAHIGASCFIDHGTGVVIGETAHLGTGVRIYQAVTLGAKRFPADADGNLKKGLPRHPIVEDDVVIYAGATILGRVTLGKGAVIGGNVWVTEDVEPGAALSQANLQSAPQQR